MNCATTSAEARTLPYEPPPGAVVGDPLGLAVDVAVAVAVAVAVTGAVAVAVAVAVILIVIFGLIGVFQVPVQLTPNVDQPVVSVQTTWFGAQPQEIEQEILQEQEEVLKTIPGLREMTSEAVEGLGTVRLEFYVGIDKTRIINEVEQKLNQVRRKPVLAGA